MTVHPTAIVSPKAQLGRGVSVGAFSVIYDNASIGDHTIIGAYCEIAHPAHNPDDRGTLTIGKRSIIRSRSTFYEGSEFGDGLVTGHAVTVRERTRAGEGLQIGTLGDIQGHCVIGNHVRFHSNVHIGHHSSVGDRVWIFPYVVLTNDPHPPSEVRQGVTVHEFAAIATMSVVLPGVVVGRGALIGAHSSVTKDVPPDSVAVGIPAKVVCRTEDVKRRDGSDKPAYPWRRHFHRGYPDVLVDSWKLEFPEG